MTQWVLKLALLVLTVATSAQAMDRVGRLGAGLSNQLLGDLPAVSFKLQKSRAFGFGGLFGIDSSDDGGMGAGLKMYRNFFDEPQLNFYGSLMGAYLSDKKVVGEDETGFQIDLTLGSEFSFVGLQSLGLAFEFGVSFNKVDEFAVQTVGDGFLVMMAHFYL